MRLKKIIREFIDQDETGFEWTNEEINPWYDYNAIIFDTIPTAEDVNQYIEMALNTQNIKNREAWQTGREHDLDRIIRYSKSSGGAVLSLLDDELSYADKEYWVYSGYQHYQKPIKYSQLKGNNLTESNNEIGRAHV